MALHPLSWVFPLLGLYNPHIDCSLSRIINRSISFFLSFNLSLFSKSTARFFKFPLLVQRPSIYLDLSSFFNKDHADLGPGTFLSYRLQYNLSHTQRGTMEIYINQQHHQHASSEPHLPSVLGFYL